MESQTNKKVSVVMQENKGSVTIGDNNTLTGGNQESILSSILKNKLVVVLVAIVVVFLAWLFFCGPGENTANKDGITHKSDIGTEKK